MVQNSFIKFGLQRDGNMGNIIHLKEPINTTKAEGKSIDRINNQKLLTD